MIEILNWIVAHPFGASVIWVTFVVGSMAMIREIRGDVKYDYRRNR